jgi:hypothetical protein
VVVAPLLALPPPGAPSPVSGLAQTAAGTLASGEITYYSITVPASAGLPAFGGAAAPPPSLLLELTLPAGAAGSGAEGTSAAPLLLLLNATSPSTLSSTYLSDANGICDAALGCHWAVDAAPADAALRRVTMAGRRVLCE